MVYNTDKCLYKTSRHIVTSNDYINLVLSTLIAGSGFILNSETVVIGSMLISPLLTPLINIALSLLKSKQDALKVISISIGHTLLMISIVLVLSYTAGYIVFKYFPHIMAEMAEIKEQKSDHIMSGRSNLVIDYPKTWGFPAIIAICGGILLARSHCFENTLTTTIIGIGISTSILPPIVASGIYSSIGNTDKAKSSIVLAILNILLILFSYTATLFFTFGKITSKLFQKST